MINFFYIIFIIIINLTLFKYIDKIAHKLNLYDYPDNKRKIHKKKTPLVGGIFFLINILYYLIFQNLFFSNQVLFESIRELISFYFGIIFFFLIGIYDDKYTLNSNTKLVLSILVILFSINLSDQFLIKDLNFIFLNKTINLNSFSILFTIFCILAFINSFNMLDGINGLSVSYYLICLFFLFVPNYIDSFYLSLLICSSFFLIYNFRGKIFLGDNGSLVLGFMLSLLFIKFYNEKKIFADEIIALMILPGIDMIRVASSRILRKKHAFEPDQNHLHHLLMKMYNEKISYFIIIGIILLTYVISKFVKYDLINILCIVTVTLIYLFFIKKIKLK